MFGLSDTAAVHRLGRRHLTARRRSRTRFVLDNLSSHKSADAVAAIDAVGARMVYLPPYSPDLNPIENIFAKIKQLKQRQPPDSRAALLTAFGGCGRVLSDAESTECHPIDWV